MDKIEEIARAVRFDRFERNGAAGAFDPKLPLSESELADARAAYEVMTRSDGVVRDELAGVHNWEVGPCVNRLGHVTSWDINIKPREGERGVMVIASVYSGEATAKAILAAIQSTVEHPLARMVRLDEEMGLYDDAALTQSSVQPD